MSFGPGSPTGQNVGRNTQEIIPISKEALVKLTLGWRPLKTWVFITNIARVLSQEVVVTIKQAVRSRVVKSCDSGISCC
jgi:hypothetical protein